MDFPSNLETKPRWVYGLDELKQNIILLLRNHAGTWLQSASIGAYFDVHSQDTQLLDEGIRKTLEQIPYIRIVKIKITLPNVILGVEYNGEVIKFQYAMDI